MTIHRWHFSLSWQITLSNQFVMTHRFVILHCHDRHYLSYDIIVTNIKTSVLVYFVNLTMTKKSVFRRVLLSQCQLFVMTVKTIVMWKSGRFVDRWQLSLDKNMTQHSLSWQSRLSFVIVNIASWHFKICQRQFAKCQVTVIWQMTNVTVICDMTNDKQRDKTFFVIQITWQTTWLSKYYKCQTSTW